MVTILDDHRVLRPRRRSCGGDQLPTEELLSGLPDAWNELIILCGGNPWSGIKLADQQLAERLAEHLPVLYIDPPQSIVRRRPRFDQSRDEAARFVRISPNVACYRPLAPPAPSRLGMASLTAALLRRLLRRLVGKSSVHAVISAWTQYPVFGTCGELVSVFWAQDNFSAAARSWGLSPERIARAEFARVKEADLVIAANTVTYDRWQQQSKAIDLIPYGADTYLFASFDNVVASTDVRLASPIAVVVGQLNFRIDLALLESVVDAGVSLLLVGPVNHPEVERMDQLLAHPLVQAVGVRPIQEIPGYLKHADVGLVPYDHSDFNEASFPLKTLEYLAARLPVVTTDLPATRWLNTPLIAIADDPESFGKAAAEATTESQKPDLRKARWLFCEQHSYARRAEAFLAAIDRIALTLDSRRGGLDGDAD